MKIELVDARYVRDWLVWCRFRNGAEGLADLAAEVSRPGREALLNPEIFRGFRIDPRHHTLAWPNGLRIDPQVVYELIRLQV